MTALVGATIDNEGVLAEAAPECAACGSPGKVLHEGLRDQLFGAPGTWSIRRCVNRSCGLGWVDPMPCVDEIAKLYATYYTHADSGSEPAGEATDAGRAKRTVQVMLAALMPGRSAQFRSGLCHLEGVAPGRLLEVGCGSGAFLGQAARAGWEAEGLDFDATAVAAANRLPGVKAVVGDLLTMGYAADSFSAIVMNNVIEHLPETLPVMRECRRTLRPSGRMILVTPNLDSIGHEIFGPDWRGLEVPRHLYLFTATTLRAYARAAGFRRVHAFAPLGAGGTDFIVESSQQIAERSGRTAPPADPRDMRRRGQVGALFGASRCEWVVLAAGK